MQGMNKHNALITGILLAVLAGSLGCRSDAEKYEVINAFLSEYEAKLQEHTYTKGDSIGLYQQALPFTYLALRPPVSVGTFTGPAMATYSIPEELKNRQSDEEFMLNFLTQEDITTWNRAIRCNRKQQFNWVPASIKGYPVFKAPPYYMEEDFMPTADMPIGGYPLDHILKVSEPVFNTDKNKVLLDVSIQSGPLTINNNLFVMYKIDGRGWKIISSLHYLST